MNGTLAAVASCNSWTSSHYCRHRLRKQSPRGRRKYVKHCSQINVTRNIHWVAPPTATLPSFGPCPTPIDPSVYYYCATQEPTVSSSTCPMKSNDDVSRSINHWRFVAPLKLSSRTYQRRLRSRSEPPRARMTSLLRAHFAAIAPVPPSNEPSRHDDIYRPVTPNNSCIATTHDNASFTESTCSNAQCTASCGSLIVEGSHVTPQSCPSLLNKLQYSTSLIPQHSYCASLSRDHSAKDVSSAAAAAAVVEEFIDKRGWRTKSEMIHELKSRLLQLRPGCSLPETDDINRLAYELKATLRQRVITDDVTTAATGGGAVVQERVLPPILDTFIKAKQQEDTDSDFVTNYRLQRLPALQKDEVQPPPSWCIPSKRSSVRLPTISPKKAAGESSSGSLASFCSSLSIDL